MKTTDNPFMIATAVITNAFHFLNKELFGNNLVLPVINILSRGRSKAVLGWAQRDKWQNDTTSEARNELSIAAETLDRPLIDVFETLVHEMVHIECMQGNIADVNKYGYHTAAFKKHAEAAGLTVQRGKYNGFSVTTLAEKARKAIELFITTYNVEPFEFRRTDNKKTYTKLFMCNVSEIDKEWIKQTTKDLECSEKALFSRLRQVFEDTFAAPVDEEEPAVEPTNSDSSDEVVGSASAEPTEEQTAETEPVEV